MPRRHRLVFISALGIALLGSSGCAHHRAATPEDAAWMPTLPVTLDVDNRNWADVIVSVIHDGRTTRLTTVVGAHHVALMLPPNLQGTSGNVQFVLRRIGDRVPYVTEPVSLRLASTVTVSIESDVTHTSVAVY